MRRPAPRPLGTALAAVVSASQPPTPLAAAQAAWPDVAGPVLAAEAEPVGEREGVLVIRCSSAVWAQELELMAPDLLVRLGERLGAPAQGSITALRFKVGSGANRT